jgi:general secretion pathway protein A
MLLQDIGFADIEITPYYDEKTREAVRAVQEKHGIRVDGVVGPLTKMILYQEKKALKLPSTRG